MVEERFTTIFNEAAVFLQLSDEELAGLLKTSIPTIKLWKSGKSTPHELAEKSIWETLIPLIIEKWDLHTM